MAIAYNFAGAAKAAAVDESDILEAGRTGKLVVHALGNRAVILADDLADWVRSLPVHVVKDK
jgi:hypothetical protein